MKHVCYCGGQISSANESTSADCFRYTWEGWKKFSTMTKPRAFSASAWVNIKMKIKICTNNQSFRFEKRLYT